MEIGSMSNELCISAISKLMELTEKLPPFPSAINGSPNDKWEKGNSYLDDEEVFPALGAESNGYREYKMDSGECFSWFIHRSGNSIAVHRWFCSKGTKFPEHTHPVREWLIIYSGIMLLQKEGKETVLRAGESIVNEPNIPHSSTYPEDCKFITVTIPPAKEFPNVNR
jgi:quercetin dioxygenase-like cupin family protein